MLIELILIENMGKYLKKFTLDTNCLLAVDEERDTAVHIKKLLLAHQEGLISLAIVASAASEMQQGKIYLENYEMFEERRKKLGFGDVEVLQAISREGVSYWDYSLIPYDEWADREDAIYKVIFPNGEIDLIASLQAHGLTLQDEGSENYQKAYWKWRNKILDAQAYWAHDHNDRDIFVTHDKDHKKLNGHPDFPRALVVNHIEAGAIADQILGLT